MSNFLKRFLVSILFIPIIIVIIFLGNWYFKLLLLSLLLLSFYEVFFIKKIYIKIFITFIFLIFLFSLYRLRFSENGIHNIILCLGVTWLSDTGGYLFGKTIGGRKIKIISPNKTYAGFFGAIFLPQILIYYFYNENFFSNQNLYYYSIVFFILSILSITGDLIFSYLKRLLNIKDYSKLIPGHGGLFDRIDSLIFVVIFYHIFVNL